MRVLVAPDSFGGTLPAPAAARAIADGWSSAVPGDDVRLCPLSAGGAGFVEAVRATLGGELLPTTVRSPLGDPVPATVLLVPDAAGGGTAYVESVAATSLSLVPVDGRDPMRTSSAGVGDLLRAALGTGARRVVVGVGEGATHDAGVGMLAALGVGAGTDGPLGAGGGGLLGLASGDLEGLDRVRGRWAAVELVAACVADLPLLGMHGASATAAQDRGATRQGAQDLERALGHAAHLAVAACGPTAVRRDLLAGSRPTTPVARLAGLPGAGAGGGLGFALAVLGARVLPGAAVVADVLGLRARAAEVDLVVTGEERFDSRSVHGGVPAVVADSALAAGVPTVVIAGAVDVGRRELASAGIAAAYPLDDAPTAVRRGPDAVWAAPEGDAAAALLQRASRVARTWSR